ELKAKDIEEFYKKHDSEIQFPQNIWQVISEGEAKRVQQTVGTTAANGFAKKQNHKLEFKEGVLGPTDYADIKATIAERKAKEIAKIELPKELPVFALNNVSEPLHLSERNVVLSCQVFFAGGH